MTARRGPCHGSVISEGGYAIYTVGSGQHRFVSAQ
jgi:hypothetical protein